MPLSFAEDVAAFADAGCQAMEVWLTKLEEHLKSHSLDETMALLDERQMTLTAGAYQGGLLLSQGEQRKTQFDHFRDRLQLCQHLNIETILLVPDFGEQIDQTSLERAVVSLKQAAQWAAGFDVRIALEFRGNASFCSNIETALALVTHCDEPNAGICLDVFHYYTGPSKLEDLALLTKDRLFFVQLCDVAGVVRELASDNDRVLPGDGDFQIGSILQQLREIGYDGWVSLELLNPTLWQANATQVAEIGITAVRKLLGLAEMPSGS